MAVFDKDLVRYAFFGTVGRPLAGEIVQLTCDMWSKAGGKTARLVRCLERD